MNNIRRLKIVNCDDPQSGLTEPGCSALKQVKWLKLWAFREHSRLVGSKNSEEKT